LRVVLKLEMDVSPVVSVQGGAAKVGGRTVNFDGN
jgi:hypothetical protein